MTMTLRGSCRCGATRFTVESHTPYPYQLCYCSICRKTAGGGGFAINLGAVASTLAVDGRDALEVYRAEIGGEDGRCVPSEGQRHFCRYCGSALWLFDPRWPELMHPFASAIDSDLPIPPTRVHMMLGSRACWVEPAIGPQDRCFEEYPEQSIADWHRTRDLWIP